MDVYSRGEEDWPNYLTRRSVPDNPLAVLEMLEAVSLQDDIAELGAAFDIAAGKVLWKLQMQNPRLLSIIAEVRAAEFEQGGQHFRKRAEDAYLNGWYQEALNDFLEAAERNYRDFTVLRAIGNIYLYDVFDYEKALDYYTRCAKYATAHTRSHAAEAMLFAAWTAYLQGNDATAIGSARQAFELNPNLAEAYYLHAKFISVTHQVESVVPSLERAIEADGRYWLRMESDPDFDEVQSELSLHDLLCGKAKAQAQHILNPNNVLENYHIVSHPETEALMRCLHQTKTLAEKAQTYLDYLELIPQLKGCRGMLEGLKNYGELGVLKGHTGWVRAVAFSPDGKFLVSVSSASSDPSIRLWDIAERKQILQIEGETNDITSAVFSPDGRLLATGSGDRTVRLWNVSTGKKVAQLQGHRDWVRSVAFNPDGSLLASASEDNTVRLWNTETKRPVALLGGAAEDGLRFWDLDSVFSIVFHPEQPILAGGARDNTVRLWNIESKKQIAQLEGHRGWVHCVAFSPDGRLLASGSRDHTICLWDVVEARRPGSGVRGPGSGKDGAFAGPRTPNPGPRAACLVRLEGHTGWVHAVAFSPDGWILASASEDKTIRLWDVATHEQLAVLEGHTDWVNTLDFSPDGNVLASGSGDCAIRLWRIQLVMTKEEKAEQESQRQAEMERRQRVEAELVRQTLSNLAEALERTVTKEREVYVPLERNAVYELLSQAEACFDAGDMEGARTLIERIRLEVTKLKTLIDVRMEEEQLIVLREQNDQCLICGKALSLLDKLGKHKKCKVHR